MRVGGDYQVKVPAFDPGLYLFDILLRVKKKGPLF